MRVVSKGVAQRRTVRASLRRTAHLDVHVELEHGPERVEPIGTREDDKVLAAHQVDGQARHGEGEIVGGQAELVDPALQRRLGGIGRTVGHRVLLESIHLVVWLVPPAVADEDVRVAQFSFKSELRVAFVFGGSLCRGTGMASKR